MNKLKIFAITFLLLSGRAFGQAAVNYQGGFTVPGPIGLLTDGGPLPTVDQADNPFDAGVVNAKGPVIQGQVLADGTQPTAAPAGATEPTTMSQDLRLYVNTGCANTLHYICGDGGYGYGLAAKGLIVPMMSSGKFLVTGFAMNAGATAQTVSLESCGDGGIVGWEAMPSAITGGEVQQNPAGLWIIPAGQNMCFNPQGSTTGYCSVTGCNIP